MLKRSLDFVGAGIGILSWFTLLISKKPIGCSTTFARTAGFVERLIKGKKVDLKQYYEQIKLKIDWQFMLVVGIIFDRHALAQYNACCVLNLYPNSVAHSSSGLGHSPLKAETRVRTPYGLP